jgi:hypothetical protein
VYLGRRKRAKNWKGEVTGENEDEARTGNLPDASIGPSRVREHRLGIPQKVVMDDDLELRVRGGVGELAPGKNDEVGDGGKTETPPEDAAADEPRRAGKDDLHGRVARLLSSPGCLLRRRVGQSSPRQRGP